MSYKLPPLLLCLLLFQFSKVVAQGNLRFTSSPFYSDTIFTGSTLLNLRVAVENISSSQTANSPIYIINNLRPPAEKDTLLSIIDSAYTIPPNGSDTFTLPLLIDTTNGSTQRVLLDLRLFSANTFQDSIIDIALINYSNEFKPRLSAGIISGVADTVFQNDTLDVEIEISNTGTADYLEDIFLVSALNNEIESFDTSRLDYKPLAVGKDNKININKEIFADPQYLERGDGNVVIVWPVGFGVEVDTSIKEVFIEWPSFILGQGEVDLQLFPNPASHSVHLKSNISVERVRIFDLSGHCVVDKRNRSTVDLSQLPSGIYSCILDLENGWKIRQKLIKK